MSEFVKIPDMHCDGFRQTYCFKAQLIHRCYFLHLMKIDSGWLIIYREGTLEVNLHSRGIKLGDMLTLAPESHTAGLCMVTKVIP